MSYVVIDSDDYAASGIETLTFPGGEPHVKVPAFTGSVLLFIKARTLQDTFFGALVADALGRQNKVKLTTFVPYFPGARQDRSDGSCGLTAHLMGRLFNGPRLFTFDIHSHVAYFQADPVDDWNLSDLLYKPANTVVGVIAPDTGATNRAAVFRRKFAPGAALIQCLKARDPNTGTLSGYKMPALPTGRGHYVVVDDICDGGGTFNLLANAFEAQKTENTLELVVSHGIFSKGIDALSPLYSRITTTDSWCRDIPNPFRELDDPSRLVVLPLNQLFDRIMGEPCV